MKSRIKYQKQVGKQAEKNLKDLNSDTEIPESTQFFYEAFEKQDEEVEEVQVNPKFGEYWSIKNGQNQILYAIVENENPLAVKYFQPTIRGKSHSLNESIYEASIEDFDKQINPPEIVQKGRNRKYYNFM